MKFNMAAGLLLVLQLTWFYTALVSCYPITGSWFQSRKDIKSVETTLKQFTSIGGEVVYLRGEHFLSRTADEVKNDDLYKDCIENGVHCVDSAEDLLFKQGIFIKNWLTYSYDDNYSSSLTKCPKVDKKIVVGKTTYYRQVLWVEAERAADDCSFVNGSQVAVMFTVFQGVDPHSLLINMADKMNVSVYLGLPKAPYLDETEEAAGLMQAYYGFVARMTGDHKARYGKNRSFKGYYSDEEVVPSYIIDTPKDKKRPGNSSLPARYSVMYWRELNFLAGFHGLSVIKAPTLDLTRAGETNITNHVQGLMSLHFFAPGGYLLKDGRGDGRAAYYSKDEANQPVARVDNSLYHILKQKNSSVTEKTTFNDVYYASISEFFEEFNSNSYKASIGLMIEAYDDLGDSSGSWCEPVDPKGSGMDRKVQRVHKSRLDKAIESVGAQVNLLTAFAWDPLFTCKEGQKQSLYEEILYSTNKSPLISKCNFAKVSERNTTIEVLGYYLDTSGVHLEYTDINGKLQYSLPAAAMNYIFYGEEHGLVKSLQYARYSYFPLWEKMKPNSTVTLRAYSEFDREAASTCSYEVRGTVDFNNQDDVIG